MVHKCVDKNSNFNAVITGIDFSSIIMVDNLESDRPISLNQIVDDTFEYGYRLTDLSYKIVGVNTNWQTVDIEVDADGSAYTEFDG